MKRKVYMAVVLVGVLIAGATLAYWGQDVNDEPRVFDEKRVYLERFREAVKNADTDLFFYGRVMDQYGLPVDGAKVTLSYDHYLPSSFWGLWLTEMTVITDTEGKFTISGIRGSALRIKEIAKDGYEFLRFGKWNPQLVFHYTLTPETSPSNIFVPDPANPVEFRLRKRGETTLLLLNRWIQGPVFRFLQRNRVWQYDLVRQVHRWTDGDPNARLFNGEPFNPDLQVQAVYDGDTSPPKWTVAIGSGLPGGGIVASDELLYEAPVEGYEPEYRFVAVEGHIDFQSDRPPEEWRWIAGVGVIKRPRRIDSPKQYLYLRSREPAIYSRIELKSVSVDDDQALVIGIGDVWTNPYGDRVLDKNPDIPGMLSVQLEAEVVQAFREGRRPIKPDLPRLIEEYKARAAGR